MDGSQLALAATLVGWLAVWAFFAVALVNVVRSLRRDECEQRGFDILPPKDRGEG